MTVEQLTGHGAEPGIHFEFRRRARERPEGTAVCHDGTVVTYSELDRMSDGVAGLLLGCGVVPGDHVAVRLPRSVSLIAIIIGVLKAGAVYTLLDVDWPRRRVEATFAQLAPKVIFGEEADRHPSAVTLPEPSLESLRAAGVDDAALRALDAVPGPSPDDACAVYFTSGSTGTPKGALSTHAGVLRLFRQPAGYGFDATVTMPALAPLPWDAFTFELWAPLLAGGTMVLTGERVLSGPVLRRLVAENGVNRIWVTAPLFRVLVEEDLSCFSGLDHVYVGGERMPPDSARTFLRRFPDCALINNYGPVESTFAVTQWPVTLADTELPGGIPIGRALPGTGIHVYDGDRPCAPDEVGEICVSGEGLARCYLGDPEQTARAFPTLAVDGAPLRVYRTGDLGWLDGRGVLHYLGRLDRQVKIRGFRVEPGEIEAALNKLAQVRHSIVIPEAVGGNPCRRLLAFVVTDDPDGIDVAALRERLLESLPEHLVPGLIVPLARLPLTANSKVDQARLLELAAASANRGKTVVVSEDVPSERAFVDELEGTIAAVLMEIVGCDLSESEYSLPYSHFGADSLDITRLCARLGAQHGIAVPVTQAFRAGSVAGIGAWLRADRLRGGPVGGLSDSAESTMMTPMEQLIFLREFHRASDRDMMCPFAWSVAEELDVVGVQAGFDRVHRRHASLRTRYTVRRGRFVARPAELAPPRMQVLRVRTWADAWNTVDDPPFGLDLDLSGARTWLPALIQVEEDGGSVVCLFAHHIGVDGGSGPAFCRDFEAGYLAWRDGESEAVDEAVTPWAIFADRRAACSPEDLEVQRSYWKSVLDRRPQAKELPPPQRPGTDGVERLAGAVEGLLPKSADELARERGVTKFSLLLTSYLSALSALTGERDILIATAVDMRGATPEFDAVGANINILPLRFDLGPRPSAADRLHHVGEVINAALAAQDIPFLEIAESAGMTVEDTLLRSMFVFQNNFDSPRAGQRIAMQPYVAKPLGLPCDLLGEVYVQGDGAITLSLSYRKQTVSEAFAVELMAAWRGRLAEDWLSRPAPVETA